MNKVKQTIAVDIDDVLSVHADAFIKYSNDTYQTNLSFNDYGEHWARLWGVDSQEVEKRVSAYHASGAFAKYQPQKYAVHALKLLSHRYTLVIVTSRKTDTADITKKWIETYYPHLFKDILHAGMWDVVNETSISATKAELCKRLGADYLIDDQLKHCIASAKLGIQAILFGDYPWNQIPKLPNKIVRCPGWSDVLEYFYAKY